MDIKETAKQLVILECRRIIEILESDAKLEPWYCPASELKAKMHELRRDTLRLEKQIYKKY